MIDEVKSILVDEDEINTVVNRIAAKISEDYANKRLLLLCTLKGAVVFMGDLMKRVTIPVEIDFMKVSSYGNSTVSQGGVNILLDLHRNDLADVDILIVEDIIDSGRTLSYLVDYLKLKGARSVKTATMLDKPSRRVVDFTPDYVGKVIPDEFVVGYGLDYAEKFRALPYIGILKPEVYENN